MSTQTQTTPVGVKPTENRVLIPSIPGITITSSQDILSPNTRLAWLIWGPSGYGKTWLTGGLDALTQKYNGKRTLYIAVESGEGGGAATIRKLGVPVVVPKDYNDLYRILGIVRNDRSIGGVVLDSGSETGKKYVKDAALKYPCRENTATRSAGIATRSDYQVMGELMSQVLRAVLALTTHENPDYRKHVIVTAADVTREEDDRVVFVGPDFPGRMRTEGTQLFQQVGRIDVKPQVVGGVRRLQRVLNFQADGVRVGKDRYEMFPADIPLRGPSDSEGENILSIWEKYWLPAVAEAQSGGAA